MEKYPLLSSLKLPEDIKTLPHKELEKVAHETRSVIIDAVSKNGGHLAPSLGVVELTIALLRVCDPLYDRIVWDVSHQSYPFKVLTDRLGNFHTVRTFGGISGFTKLKESPYDAFGTGHASTSISAGLGIVCADELSGIKRKVVSVIGDGALSGGMAFEAMNSLGTLQKPMVVVLNDNEMSISPNVGAVSNSLSKMMTGELASSLRDGVRKVIDAIPGKRLKTLADKLEDGIISFFTPGILFEEFGLRYIGPINGHNIKDLEKALNMAFALGCPALVHIGTKKGKGYKYAEDNPGSFHGVSSFDIDTGKSLSSDASKSWTKEFGEKLCEMAENDGKIVAVTAAMSDGTGLNSFAKLFPNRFYDTGIAEEHAMTFAAGLAVAGAKPYISLYSTFLQRAFDQVIHDVALQELPVRICIDRGGLVGQDGPTHHGAFDISFMRIIPNLSIMLPRDLIELNQMLEMSLKWDGALAIRYARGAAFSKEDIPRTPIVAGEPEVIFDGSDFAVISAGHIFEEAHKLYNALECMGYSTSLINLRFIKPLNKDTLLDAVKGKKAVITFEENVKAGGAGEMIKLAVNEAFPEVKVIIMSLPDEFVTHGSVGELRRLCGLTAENAISTLEKKGLI